MKKFIFTKIAGMRLICQGFYADFKNTVPPMLSPCMGSSLPSNVEEPPPTFSTPVGNPEIVGFKNLMYRLF